MNFSRKLGVAFLALPALLWSEEETAPDLRVHSIQIRQDGLSAEVWDKSTGQVQNLSVEPRSQGWRIVEVIGDLTNPSEVRVKIEIGEGKIVEAPLEKQPKKPTNDLRELFGKLSPEQRQEFSKLLMEFRQQNPNVSRDDLKMFFGEQLRAAAAKGGEPDAVN